MRFGLKKLLFPLILVALPSFIVNGQSRYERYNNQRFAYSIEYPSDLLRIQPPAFNGDGRVFVSDDKSVEMRVWANFNVLFLTLEQQFAKDLSSYGSAKYKTILQDGYVISGIKDNKIFYQKTLYHKFANVDVFYTFVIEYPKSLQKTFDPIIKRVTKSFRFDPNADV